MENTLLMRRDTSFALNFLIYIQNVYLNQNPDKKDFKFPYLSIRMPFKEDFELRYIELWNDVSQKISGDNGSRDLKIFYKEKELFYQHLFEDNRDSQTKFNEVYKSFQVWWDSFAGRFSVERSIDETTHNLYLDLANFLKESGVEPKKPLKISLIYDECLLVNPDVSSYFAVLPTKDFYIKYKELVPKLGGCFY
ncbi:hypothetical protein [Cytobacillus praedii]|uniref:Uncharacterized protein n=1 Tax=Cytobacillus praedii TaxID=1742358 RepID=A0A4R1AWE8_9BACI|nr:hypothetical protein [Cytobacillus praedii]TCJ02541.1 hypothetical protein E0Y62_19125 [Cytobacillus praedii]